MHSPFSPLRPLAASIVTLLVASSPLLQAADIAAAGPSTKKLAGPERVPQPKLAPASNEPNTAASKFKLPPGFATSVWASEPMLGNPVAFAIDEKGAVFVAETFRYRSSVLDIRHYMFMLEDDLASRSTDDRIAYTKKNFPTDWQNLEIETEVVRRIEDTNGDGKADASTEYASGMSTLLDGINSGVLAYDGKVWCTNMPNLWQFSGLKDGKAEKRESLSFGYGVRYSFTGHDMHGLAMGPDGRLYFSFGDRGAYVKTKEGKTLAFSDEGAVFRCELDGSNMEVFYRGLRNPQELAFDNHGNLFTGDNDCDMGDRERWVYLVEGGESGWRVGWQHPPLGKERNMWLVESMWEPRKEGTPYYVLSPIMNIPDGPSGVVHNPGTGLPAQYDDAFFVCGFKGTSARSAISWWTVKETGAGFLPQQSPATFVDNVQATDVDFGPDSKMYFSEWGEGWEGTGRGRIFALENAEALKTQAAQVAEVKKLLGEGFKQRPTAELAKLLGHKDQRIRLQAQWALATKSEAAETFLAVAKTGTDPLARLHGIWGLGHIARLAGYKTADEVRAQTAKVLGEGKAVAAFDPLVAALKDESARVKFFATQSLGKLSKAEGVQPILSALRENGDRDEFLRHAGVMALIGTADAPALAAAAKDASKSVRLAALLAMRREQKAEIAQFLNDAEPLLVKEAARAINDEGIAGGLGALAKLIEKPTTDINLMIRVLNANYRVGTPEAAQALATFANHDTASEALRVEAVRALGTWPKPEARDRVAGVFRPLGDRDGAPAVAALQSALPKLLAAKSDKVATAAVEAVQSLGLKAESGALFALVSEAQRSAKLRGNALAALASFDDPKLADAVKLAMTDKDAGLRVEALSLLGKLDPEEAAKQLSSAYATSAVPEKKVVINSLATLKGPGADQALAAIADEFLAGKMAPEVQLELVEAISARKTPQIQAKLKSYQANLPKDNRWAAFEPTMVGGEKNAGEKLFKEHAAAQCGRCHKVGGVGGDAGPDLTGIGAKKDRRYLLESIVDPNLHIAEGFQSLMVTLKNGDIHGGVVKKETATEVTLQMPIPDAKPVTVAKADITARENTPSGMPPNMPDVLTKREIRDVVEYLASLK
jgi:quinoprotein glucose dehydrogenase